MNTVKLSYEELSQSDIYNSFTAIEVDPSEFVSCYGEQQLLEFQEKLTCAGFFFAGKTQHDTLIFSFPTPLRDFLRDEIEEILEHEIFAIA